MHDHDKAPPVSGEIMTEPKVGQAMGAAGEFTDAEFESVGVGNAGMGAGTAYADQNGVKGMDFLTPSPERKGERSARGGAGFWISGLVIVFGAFWIAGGHSLVRQIPMPLLLEREGPLRLADVTSRVEDRDTLPILFVDGAIENHGKSPRVLPTLRIAVVDVDGASTNYFLGTNDSVLDPGQRYDFSSRLEAPRTGVSSVSVTFQEDMR